jgi:Holliday junction resolvase RusA-like endonuclease
VVTEAREPRSWSFMVDGPPQGKGRPRASTNRRTGAIVMRTPEETRRYESWVAICARPFMPREKITGPLAMSIALVVPRPQYLKDHQRDVLGPVKPDYDNAAKAVTDGLKAHFRDEQVCRAVITKRYANPGEKPHAFVVVERMSA